MKFVVNADLTQGEIDVLSERKRQQLRHGENFTAAHDDEHVRGELAEAAAAYLTNTVVQLKLISDGVPAAKIAKLAESANVPSFWPWHREWWKPRDARRNLIRAAALILAEIDRLDRATEHEKAAAK